MPRDRKVKWILSGDIQPLIPVIRSNGKYGLFRPQINGMGGRVSRYYSTPNPFRYDDVRICVPELASGNSGYLATLENGEWSILAVDIHSHPLKMVEGCKSFDEAKCKMEEILGKASPYPWITFDQVLSL